MDVCGYGTPTYEDIKKLKYSEYLFELPRRWSLRSVSAVKAVIDETLRLFPPVPLNQRQSRPTSCTLPPPDKTFLTTSEKPLYMPKSTTFFYSTFLMQRNKALWGPDADEFDPERWIDPKRLSRFTSNPMMFTPFSAGPRIVSTLIAFIPLRNQVLTQRPPILLRFSASVKITRITKHRSSSSN